jgi:hypothetical protein
MRNITRPLAATAIVLLLLTLPAYKSNAQEIPKADNTIHDKMYYMIQNSSNIILPETVAQRIVSLNENNPGKAKAMYSQTRALKVLHNTTLSKEDLRFFGNQLLKSSSPAIIAIKDNITKLLTNL